MPKVGFHAASFSHLTNKGNRNLSGYHLAALPNKVPACLPATLSCTATTLSLAIMSLKDDGVSTSSMHSAGVR